MNKLVQRYLDRNDIIYKIQDDKYIDFIVDDIKFKCIDGAIETYIVDECKTQDIIIITSSENKSIFGRANSRESNGLKYKNKCPEPLIGVDIDLFDKPEFPYKKDKPKCFYKVRVDGKMSAYDAFYDEKIRWKMIINRILYSGGFIDANWVLSAQNITRTCKQPSWFSKSFAKTIIQKFCSHDVIVDPFAGWGMRADASKELGRPYVGSDYNKELVEWHKSIGRDIEYANAMDFKYDGKCSVFICPPYSDPVTGRCFEDYNFDEFDNDAKQKTQCDWLKIVMENVPNAAEYIMVCKVVDKGWDKYIVDTKDNQSHFGKNSEYILCVRQSEREEILSNDF